MRLDPYPKFAGSLEQIGRKVSDQFREHAQQVNLLSEGLIAGAYAARTSVPTTGTWKQGDFVRNSTPTEAGAASSKYVVLGWLRLTDGTANVLNTDWVEARVLTGG
jgi:hypothetical protein